MSYLNNSNKYNSYYSPSLTDQFFLDEFNIPDKNDITSIDNSILFFNDDTDSYNQHQLKDGKNEFQNSSSESNKNASTNPATNSIKDGPIFEISKTPKSTDGANNIYNANNTDKASNTNNTNLGKKRKKPINYKNGKHDKYCYDNLTRKVKPKLFESIRNILNLSLSKKGYPKTFLKIIQSLILNTNTEFNRDLLKSKLKDIFSNEVYSKVKNYDKNHNKNLIEEIYKDNILTKTISILEKTLLECLEHFRGSKYYVELEGLEEEYQAFIDELISKGETNAYIMELKEFVSRFDKYYFYEKKSKPKNKKIKE